MKRAFCLSLTVLLISSILCIPCAAEETWPMKQRGYPSFSDIPSTGSLYFDAVKTCYEFDWIDGIDGETFGVNEPLSKSEMVTLLARLYSVRHGGRGTIPELPEDLGDCVRFYDTDGTLVCNAFSGYAIDLVAGPHELTAIFYDADLPQEALTIEIGFPGDGIACSAQGVRVNDGVSPTYNGILTKYNFTFPESVELTKVNPQEFQEYCRFLMSTLEVNRRENLDDPNDYTAILYLLYREPAHLPWCSRTMSLESAYEDTVWRAEFAIPLSGICSGLPDICEAESLPDMPDNWRFHEDETEAVLSLYRKGILTGYDKAGTFGPDNWLTRGQAAIITARVLAAMQA